MVGPQPGGHVSQPHGGQSARDVLPVAASVLRGDGIDDGLVPGPAFCSAQRLRPPDTGADAGFPGSGRPDDQADLPRFRVGAIDGQIGVEVETDAVRIEQGAHQSGAVGMKGRCSMVDGDLHTRTTLQA